MLRKMVSTRESLVQEQDYQVIRLLVLDTEIRYKIPYLRTMSSTLFASRSSASFCATESWRSSRSSRCSSVISLPAPPLPSCRSCSCSFHQRLIGNHEVSCAAILALMSDSTLQVNAHAGEGGTRGQRAAARTHFWRMHAGEQFVRERTAEQHTHPLNSSGSLRVR